MARTFLALVMAVPSILVSAAPSLALSPPLGWNSWDCWRGPGNQSRFYEAADVFAEVLLPVGYDTMTVDMGWYYDGSSLEVDEGRPTLGVQAQPYHIDDWGRVIANPQQWPDGIDGAARHLHSLGLMMGIHVMRGINHQAVSANTPILNIATGRASGYFANDIVTASRDTCPWCDGYFAVNTSHPAAQLWYDSNAALYKEFGIDFLKADCYYGKRDEIPTDAELQMFLRSIHEHTGAVVISLSPGVNADTDESTGISDKVNMYRISDDLWDCWNDGSECSCDDGIRVTQQFERLHAHQVAGLIGADGYLGKSWPDPDMLPVGEFAHRPSSLTDAEQRVVMTLWSIARAPLMVGADPVKLNASAATRAIVANPEVIRVNQEALSSHQLHRDGPSGPWGAGAHVRWVAQLPGNISALALFNLGDDEASVAAALGDGECAVRDLWDRQDVGTASGSYARTLPPHSSAFVTLANCAPPPSPAVSI